MLKGSSRQNPDLPDLRRIVRIGSCKGDDMGVETQSYSMFVSKGASSSIDEAAVKHEQSSIRPEDVLNLQFTSGKSAHSWCAQFVLHFLFLSISLGTTGSPKAAMLTHM